VFDDFVLDFLYIALLGCMKPPTEKFCFFAPGKN